VQLVSKISNLCDPDPPTSQTDGQTDGRHAISIPRLVHRAVKMPDFGHFISLDGMNSVFSLNKYKKYCFHFWLLASARKNLALARKIMVLPE